MELIKKDFLNPDLDKRHTISDKKMDFSVRILDAKRIEIALSHSIKKAA